MKSSLLCLALVCLPSWACAQALWRDVPAGSTPAEVSQRIAEARPAGPATLAQAPQALLEIPGFEIAGADFAVHFLFEQERLQSVVLRADAGSPEAARALAQRVYSSLRTRYGLEISARSRGAAPPTTAMDRRWVFRRTTVHLQVVQGSTVMLTYGVEPARRTNVL